MKLIKKKHGIFMLSVLVTLMVYVSLERDDFGIDALNEHHVWNSADSAIVGFPLEFLRPEILEFYLVLVMVAIWFKFHKM